MEKWRLIFLVLMACAFQGSQAQQDISYEVKSLQVKAEAGDADSQFTLANIFDSGRGAPRNGAEAMKWYQKAAEQGHVEAQNSLGSIYQAEKRYSEALLWYQKAADHGHALATNNLAYLYDHGLGVPQSRKKGHELYMKSANLGWAEAMFNLANMYGAGQLGEVDYYKAYVWCSRSGKYVESGWREVKKRSSQCLKYLNNKLSSEQIAQARKEAESWTPGTPNQPIKSTR